MDIPVTGFVPWKFGRNDGLKKTLAKHEACCNRVSSKMIPEILAKPVNIDWHSRLT